MEKERLDRSQAGAGRKTWPRFGIARTASAVASFLLVSASSAAFAGDASCRASQPVFSGPTGLERVASRLRHHEPVRVLAIGSSSTQGIGASSPDFSYPAQLQADLTRMGKGTVTVENAGKGGETISETVGRLEAALKSSKPDLVIWQVGTNDAIKGGDEARFSTLLRQGIDAAQALGVEVVLVDQQYYPAIKDLNRYERFVSLVGATAAAEQVPVFSRYALMKGWGERSSDVLHSMLSGDGFHMGDHGYDCMAQLIAEGLHSIAAPKGTTPNLAVTAAARP
ncbi:SGNH/GDSL hydrolase family protein [Microvirga sp. VF16]|uniref:SGNH/GDSL hydrolase family protein n=1 Tax=Microvirga sp. VF16 TaxID=2807101 RepID=UPI00193CAEF2|nr:SGNH/GDSL hydrolase family protein [Microvirga sp. VF16]QRM31226.1 SGNH/GDSL hydrolase family protein [Microvirga sp. VF16]